MIYFLLNIIYFLFFVEINQRDCLGKQINGYQNLPNVPICHQGEALIHEIIQVERLPFDIRYSFLRFLRFHVISE
jgi:hypothetical protein